MPTKYVYGTRTCRCRNVSRVDNVMCDECCLKWPSNPRSDTPHCECGTKVILWNQICKSYPKCLLAPPKEPTNDFKIPKAFSKKRNRKKRRHKIVIVPKQCPCGIAVRKYGTFCPKYPECVDKFFNNP